MQAKLSHIKLNNLNTFQIQPHSEAYNLNLFTHIWGGGLSEPIIVYRYNTDIVSDVALGWV